MISGKFVRTDFWLLIPVFYSMTPQISYNVLFPCNHTLVITVFSTGRFFRNYIHQLIKVSFHFIKYLKEYQHTIIPSLLFGKCEAGTGWEGIHFWIGP